MTVEEAEVAFRAGQVEPFGRKNIWRGRRRQEQGAVEAALWG